MTIICDIFSGARLAGGGGGGGGQLGPSKKEASHQRRWSDPVRVKHWESTSIRTCTFFFGSPSFRSGRPTERFSPWVGARP